MESRNCQSGGASWFTIVASRNAKKPDNAVPVLSYLSLGASLALFCSRSEIFRLASSGLTTRRQWSACGSPTIPSPLAYLKQSRGADKLRRFRRDFPRHGREFAPSLQAARQAAGGPSRRCVLNREAANSSRRTSVQCCFCL